MMFLSLVHFMGESQNSPTVLDNSLHNYYHITSDKTTRCKQESNHGNC
jgi:hypothetical protein